MWKTRQKQTAAEVWAVPSLSLGLSHLCWDPFLLVGVAVLFILYKNKDIWCLCLLESFLWGQQYCWKLKNGLLTLKWLFLWPEKPIPLGSMTHIWMLTTINIYTYSIVINGAPFQPYISSNRIVLRIYYCCYGACCLNWVFTTMLGLITTHWI